ncbi:uncharacterized protein LOC119080293 isoform X2 [Bradysia coprophila]|uniref:uncharacterized protein LOC119080293 isoform X2 n=1 Tax=Bradysia coprophila TaxID=38358 RepID=UPI00187D9C64|nr:uncharacterized protein LOC119080293 isoform X2 [Bradysia coprophila]
MIRSVGIELSWSTVHQFFFRFTMKYIGLIALVFIFQSIDVSFACNYHDIELLDYESGVDNMIKFEKGAQYEITSDCRAFAKVNATIARKVTSALISYKLKTNYGDLLTVKNMDLCQFMSEFDISGTECPASPGQATIKMNGNINYTTYGPLLELFAGPVTLLIKICYDGDEFHPDVFSAKAIIKKKNFV